MEKSYIEDEKIFTQLIETSLEGVMFHNYNIDIFDILELDGFKKMHNKQYIEENNNLKKLKHDFICQFHKLPMITLKATNLWTSTFENITEEQIPEIVKTALQSYYDWETQVLNNLLTWKKASKQKNIFQNKIWDVMTEIDKLETIMDILDEHEYNYDCICEMSTYLLYC